MLPEYRFTRVHQSFLVNNNYVQHLNKSIKTLYLINNIEIPETPVFSVSGNHDYPILPIPYIETDICSYYTFQEWLKVRNERLGVLWQQDESGAYAIQMENVDIIGLNATSHWRRFVFQQGKQLEWLEDFLQNSSAKWHVIICHAPLAEHNPLRKNGTNRTYLSRDGELQRILDKHQNVIFISGHTHVSPNIPEGCVFLGQKSEEATKDNLQVGIDLPA